MDNTLGPCDIDRVAASGFFSHRHLVWRFRLSLGDGRGAGVLSEAGCSVQGGMGMGKALFRGRCGSCRSQGGSNVAVALEV